MHWLSQAPHHWYYTAPFLPQTGKSGAKTRLGNPSESARGTLTKQLKDFCGARLVGPSKFKMPMNLIMMGRPIKTGDITVIIHHDFNQEVSWSNDGRINNIAANKTGTRVEVAIPMTDTQPETASEGSAFFHDRLVAIDLGERGFSWAVFDCSSQDEIANGSRKVSSIRNVAQRSEKYRKKDQSRIKFGVRYANRLADIRKEAIGDVCATIVSLMEEYRAFPVFESYMGNAGSPELQIIYASVKDHFMAVAGNPTANNRRKTYWWGFDKLEHPYLVQYVWDQTKGVFKDKTKPLFLYPGQTVNGARSSLIHYKCGGDPIAALYKLPEKDPVHIARPGIVTLDTGENLMIRRAPIDQDFADDGSMYNELLEIWPLRVITEKDNTERHARWRKEQRRIKRHVGTIVPIDPGQYTRDQIIAMARKAMRQPSKHANSKDTKQAWYHCLFVDCGETYHADENAARVLGKRFLNDKCRKI